MKLLKNLLISAALALGLVGAARAQSSTYLPLPADYPFNVVQYTFTDNNFHSTPYALGYATNGIVYLITDPSASPTDAANCLKHAQKAASASNANSAVLIPITLPGVVSTAIGSQETRVAVPFVVANSTTLQTIPFNFPTNLEQNGHYRFEAHLYVNAGVGGAKIDVGGTCNTSNFVAAYKGLTTTTLVFGGQLTSFLSGPSGSSTTGITAIELYGELDVTNGGTFVIQFAQNASNATPSVVLAGSTLTVVQIP